MSLIHISRTWVNEQKHYKMFWFFFGQIEGRKRIRTKFVVISEIEHGLSFIVSKFVLIIFKWFAYGELCTFQQIKGYNSRTEKVVIVWHQNWSVMVPDFVYKFQIVCLTLGNLNYGMENWKIGRFGKSRGITPKWKKCFNVGNQSWPFLLRSMTICKNLKWFT